MADSTQVTPAVVADDSIRWYVAWAVIFNDGITCLAVLFVLFYYGGTLSKDVLAIASTIIGSIIGYRARDTGTVIGYLFGSSSGSTAKSALLEKASNPQITTVTTEQPKTTTTTVGAPPPEKVEVTQTPAKEAAK